MCKDLQKIAKHLAFTILAFYLLQSYGKSFALRQLGASLQQSKPESLSLDFWRILYN